MNTPQKISFKEWSNQVDMFLSLRAFLVSEEDRYYCAHCITQLKGINAYISEHDSMWSDCAGGGEVQSILIPYCPNCESKPEEYGCLHDVW